MYWVRSCIKWCLPNKWANTVICWWSYWHFDIHTEEDDIKKIPDNWNEYKCQRCGKIFKL